MNSRQADLQQWLSRQCQLKSYTLEPLVGDASFRRYFRVQQDGQSFIVMDAPPEKENCFPFVAIAQAWHKRGLHVPEILARDLQQGFLLLTDFGDELYLKTLTVGNADKLYNQALDALILLQQCHEVTDWPLPSFSGEFIYQELQLVKTWFLETHLHLKFTPDQEKVLAESFQFLAKMADAQPRVAMHRDYHSANLLLLNNNQTGIIDFQDAFHGPLTYDLVSLLRDCYIDWPPEKITAWALGFYQRLAAPPFSEQQFLQWFDCMGVQRHLKALLTFSRKLHRDNNANYLQYMPRTLNYIREVAPRYKELSAFNQLLEQIIFPAYQQVKN